MILSRSALPFLALLLTGCFLQRTPAFETASQPPDEPRRPDGVAVDLETSLPPTQTSGSTNDGLLALEEPIDFHQAIHAVRAFFRAVLEEDLEAMEALLTEDAQQLPLGAGSGMPLSRHWERRFRQLDYTLTGGEPPYRESMADIYRFEDLADPIAGRPLRPATMMPDDVLVRVMLTRTRSGLERIFGEEMLFILQRTERRFEIRTLYEDFMAP